MTLRILGSLVVALLVAVALAAYAVLGTRPGLDFVLAEVDAMAPGVVAVDGLDGTLLGGVRARAVHVRLARVRVDVEGLSLRLAAAPLLAGRVELAGPAADRVEVQVEPSPEPTPPFRVPSLGTPVPVALRGVAIRELVVTSGATRTVVGGVELAAAWRGRELTVTTLRGVLAGLALDARGRATLAEPLPLHAELRWRIAEPALDGAGTLDGTLDELRTVQHARIPGTVHVAGVLRGLREQPDLQATADWASLSLPLPGVGTAVAGAGRARLAGWLHDWQAGLDTRVRVAPLPEGALLLDVRGDGGRLEVRDARYAGAFGALAARGTVDLGDGPRFDLVLDGRGLDPSALRREAHGRLDARVAVAGQAGREVRIALRDLHGQLMGRPASGTGAATWRPDGWTVQDLRLAAGPNHLYLSGSVGRTIAGSARVEAPRLGVLWPEFAGALRGSASFAGTPVHPVVDAELEGAGLTVAGIAAQALHAVARIDAAGRLDASVRARGLTARGRALGDADLAAAGDLRHHDLRATLAGGQIRGHLEGGGSWDGRRLEERLAVANVATDLTGRWDLQAGGTLLQWSARDGASAGAHCWSRDAARLCFTELHASPHSTAVAGTLRDFPLATLQAFLPADLRVDGRADADVDLRQADGPWLGRIDWQQHGTSLTYGGEGQPLSVAFPQVQLHAEARPTAARLHAVVDGENGIALRADATLDGDLAADPALGGQVTAVVPDIAGTVLLLLPSWDLTDVKGRLSSAVTLGGTVANPKVTGQVALADAAVTWPDIGLRLEAIEITARGNEAAALAIDGSARAGGDVHLTGELRLLGPDAPAGWIRVQGRDLDAVKIPDRYVRASPDVTLRLAAGKLALEGLVRVPKAEIVVRGLPGAAVSTSPDVVVHGRSAAAAKGRGPAIGGGIGIELGDKVHVQAFGLDTRLTGGLGFYQNTDGYLAADGVVRLEEGRYGAYGKELTIDRGTFGFSGALDDPALDVRASRRVDYEGQRVTAGLLLTGTAKRPQSRVFSEPAMAEADALSYLVSGKPMSTASSADRGSMGAAALGLGLNQTASLSGLTKATTLDELGVEGGAVNEAQVVAGKQLGSDLYVRFAYGLFSRVSSVLARYKLSRRVSIEASSGENESLDLVYSIELD